MSDVLDNPHRPNADGESRPIEWTKVGMMELNHHWAWLGARLKERYPFAGERECRSYLMGCLADNDVFFVCNKGAVGLFRLVRPPFQPRHVEEEFCLCDAPPDRCDFAEQLYRPVGGWIRRLGIRDFFYMRCSDAGADFVARREARAFGQRTDKTKVMIMEDDRGSA